MPLRPRRRQPSSRARPPWAAAALALAALAAGRGWAAPRPAPPPRPRAAAPAGLPPAALDEGAGDGGSEAAAGDYGYPFHDGRSAVDAALLAHVQGTVVDAAVSRVATSAALVTGLGRTTGDAVLDSVVVAALWAAPAGTRLGVDLGQRRNRETDQFAAGEALASARFARDTRDASLLAAAPLPLGLGVAVRYGYHWVSETDERADDGGPRGDGVSGRAQYAALEPSLLYSRDALELALTHKPQVSLRGPVVQIAAPASARLLASYRLGDGGALVTAVTYAWYGALAAAERNAMVYLVGMRRPVSFGELGAFLRYSARHNQEDADATPARLARQSADLSAALALAAGGRLGLVAGFSSGRSFYDGGDLGSVRVTILDYAVQLAFTQPL